MSVEFIDCTSLSIGYNIMGIATVSYTVIHNTSNFVVYQSISAGGRVFKGYANSVTFNRIPKTEGWYETHVTLITTTD